MNGLSLVALREAQVVLADRNLEAADLRVGPARCRRRPATRRRSRRPAWRVVVLHLAEPHEVPLEGEARRCARSGRRRRATSRPRSASRKKRASQTWKLDVLERRLVAAAVVAGVGAAARCRTRRVHSASGAPRSRSSSALRALAIASARARRGGARDPRCARSSSALCALERFDAFARDAVFARAPPARRAAATASSDALARIGRPPARSLDAQLEVDARAAAGGELDLDAPRREARMPGVQLRVGRARDRRARSDPPSRPRGTDRARRRRAPARPRRRAGRAATRRGVAATISTDSPARQRAHEPRARTRDRTCASPLSFATVIAPPAASAACGGSKTAPATPARIATRAPLPAGGGAVGVDHREAGLRVVDEVPRRRPRDRRTSRRPTDRRHLRAAPAARSPTRPRDPPRGVGADAQATSNAASKQPKARCMESPEPESGFSSLRFSCVSAKAVRRGDGTARPAQRPEPGRDPCAREAGLGRVTPLASEPGSEQRSRRRRSSADSRKCRRCACASGALCGQ